MEKIGYVAVLFKEENLLPDLFEGIAMQTCPAFCIYLIDNAPCVEMRAMIDSLRNKYHLLSIQHFENTKNLGAAEANNIGIKMAIKDGCTACILSNTDITYDDPGLFCEMAKLSGEKKAEIIAPKIYYFNTKKIWYAGGDIVKWKGGVVHYLDKKEDTQVADTSGFTGYAPTTFVYIKTSVFKDIGFLDKQYFLYMEDTEWMYRAGLAGYKIWYASNIHLMHKVSITTGGILSDLGIFYNTRNRLFFIREYLNLFLKCIAIFYTITSTAFFVLKKWKKSAWKAYFKAIGAGLFTTLKPQRD